MSWHDYDEKLIRRGELILDLGFVRNYQAELDAMNRGKEGKPFRLTNSYVQFLAVVRYLYGMPYRQLEGFTRALGRIVGVPSGDYTSLRKRVLEMDMGPFEGLAPSEEPLTIALDSTGVRVMKAGGWMERQHGVKKKYLKVHFAVSVRTKEVVAMEVTTDERHDSTVAERLVVGAERNAGGPVREVLGDGAYDSARIYEFLKGKGIGAVIKPRKNSVLNTRSDARRQEAACTALWAIRSGQRRRATAAGGPLRRHIPPSRGRSGSVLWPRRWPVQQGSWQRRLQYTTCWCGCERDWRGRNEGNHIRVAERYELVHKAELNIRA